MFKRPVLLPNHYFLKVFFKKSKRRVIFSTVTILILSAAAVIYFILSKSSSKEKDDSSDINTPSIYLGNHTVYLRKDWNASAPLARKKLPRPIGLVIISHSATSSCDSFESCAKKVQNIQHYHIYNSRYDDICYNFLIGGDSNVYVGRGWDAVNCHKKLSIGINLIGNFEVNTLNNTMIEILKLLLRKAVSLRKLTKDYVLVGHNQTCDTLSPGKYAYEVIKTFPSFRDWDLRKR